MHCEIAISPELKPGRPKLDSTDSCYIVLLMFHSEKNHALTHAGSGQLEGALARTREEVTDKPA